MNRHKRNNKLPLLQYISTSHRVDVFPPNHLLMEGSSSYLEPAKRTASIKSNIYVQKNQLHLHLTKDNLITN